MQTMLTLFKDNHDIKGRKNIIVICKDLVSVAQKIFTKVDRKKFVLEFHDLR